MAAWGYQMQLADPEAKSRAEKSTQPSGESVKTYKPRPVDLSNMTLSKEMSMLAEKVAENSHLIWSKRAIEDIISRGACKFWS